MRQHALSTCSSRSAAASNVLCHSKRSLVVQARGIEVYRGPNSIQHVTMFLFVGSSLLWRRCLPKPRRPCIGGGGRCASDQNDPRHGKAAAAAGILAGISGWAWSWTGCVTCYSTLQVRNTCVEDPEQSCKEFAQVVYHCLCMSKGHTRDTFNKGCAHFLLEFVLVDAFNMFNV